MASLYREPVYRIVYSALPLTGIWLLIWWILSRSGQSGWLLNLAGYSLCFLSGLAGLTHLWHAAMRITWAGLTFRKHLPSLSARMIRMYPKFVRFRSEIVKMTMHGIFFVVSMVLAAEMHSKLFWGPAAFAFGVLLTNLLRVLLPPGGLFLASSNPERVRFFGLLNLRCVPQFGALLEISNHVSPNQGSGQFLRELAPLLNDFRTTKDADWTSVATELIEMCPLIVVDGRDCTPGVQSEVAKIVGSRLDFKTVFLSDDQDLPPVLKILGLSPTHPGGKFVVMTSDLALAAVPAMVMRGARSFWVPARVVNRGSSSVGSCGGGAVPLA